MPVSPKPVAAAALCLMLLSACNESNQYVAPPPAKVTVATPLEAPVTLYATFTGNTAASASVDLEARVQGFLTAIDYTDGEAVQKGKELFRIEQAPYQAEVAQKTAMLDAARATQTDARLEYDRQSALGERDVASKSKVDNARAALDTANAQVAAAEANLKIAEVSLGYTTVSAPFSGVVTRHLADVGALVGSSGPTKLATILQVSPLDIYFNITEQQQLDLRDTLEKAGKTLKSLREDAPDMPAEILLSSDSDEIYTGHIDYIAPNLDPQTGTLQMRATLENADIALVPGLFVRVRVPVGRLEKALLVNDTAILSAQAGSYVMVVGADNVVAQRSVTTGPVEGPLRVITAGLSAGDRVVIGAIQKAVAGNTVQPVEGAMAALPAGQTAAAPAAANP
ncbi:efflux RND transporter periplasmic adaptor subunit [Pseudoxanthobacter sp.]|uniref:efflux RND transporter periplasmic adaptor subunit n=1 Tax=Pseudoxanthobacter sp. TaxID=1925742 RepID=UPI002FE2A3F1